MNYKKINSYDVANLVEGTVNEVSVNDYVNVIYDNKSIIMLTFSEVQIPIIEDISLYDYSDVAIIVNEKIVKQFGHSKPFVDCGEFYMTITDYIESEWYRGALNLENIPLTDNKLLYSCIYDELSGEKLPIWDWCIGYSEGDKGKLVRIGDLRKTYVDLFKQGDLIEDMVDELFNYNN